MMVEHGGNIFALAKEYGYDMRECVDFSANINPFGLSQALKGSILASLEELVHYPDINYSRAKKEIAQYHNVDESSILVANGAVEIFYDLARVLRPKRVLMLQPTFMEYEKAFSLVGSDLVYLRLEAPDFTWSLEQMMSCLGELSKGDALIICNPNNPTGSLVDRAVLGRLASYLKEKDIVLVIDEAFLDFLPNEYDYSLISDVIDYPNVIVVRSLTKFYAIPGLRLGYAISYHPTCLEQITSTRPPWTVNALAESSLPVILHDEEYRQRTRKWLIEEKRFLYSALTNIKGIVPVKPSANYIFFTYDGDLDLRLELRKLKVFIRSCANYHSLTDKHYRIAIRSRQENQLLIDLLTNLLGSEDDL